MCEIFDIMKMGASFLVFTSGIEGSVYLITAMLKILFTVNQKHVNYTITRQCNLRGEQFNNTLLLFKHRSAVILPMICTSRSNKKIGCLLSDHAICNDVILDDD